MTIGERIKALRKGNKLTQEEFGERIGLKGTAIGMYEKGNRQVSNQSITLISQAFHVREEWLRTGEEPMELPMMSTLLADANIGEDDRVIIQMYLELPVEKRQILKDYILNVAAELSTIKQPADSSMDTSETAPPMTSREKAHRLVDEQYEAIERGSHTV